MNFASSFLKDCHEVLDNIDSKIIESMADILSETRENNGRLFLIGSGGGAGHASHAVCDFRKLCNIESYNPYDNISELTARVNDEGWENTIINWLKVSKLNSKDTLFVFSVGGGDYEKNISANLANAVQYCKELGGKVIGVVGKDGGYTKQMGDAVCVIPTVNSAHITPLVEGFQAIVWHLLVSHPKVQINPTKWESTK